MASREQAVVDRVEAILYRAGCYNLNIHGTAMGGRAGKPDVIGSVRGRFTAIECKARGNCPTYVQWLNLVQVVRGGGRGLIAYPDVSEDDVLEGSARELHIPDGPNHEAAMALFKESGLGSATTELVEGR